MKTANIAFVAVALMSVALLAAPASVMADGGKMVVVNYLWPSPPPPPPRPVMNFGNAVQKPQLPPAPVFDNQQSNDFVQKADHDAKNAVMSDDNSYRVVLPKPGGGDVLKDWNPLDPESATPSDWKQSILASDPDDAFTTSEQFAIVAWNGHEELLILSTQNKVNLPEGSASLSVIPLPGKPISIERASLKSIVIAKAILGDKLRWERDECFGIHSHFIEPRLDAHSVFVMYIESKDDFLSKVQYSIANFYNNKAAAVITPDALKVVEQYLEEGFRYFAFDLTFVDNELSTKEAIAYRFESQYLYFPLRISQVGGEGDTIVDLVVLTTLGNKMMTFTPRSGVGVNYPGLATKFAPEPFSSKDLNDIDKSLADLFGNQTVYGRSFMFRSDKIDGFQNDFEAIPQQ